MCITCFMLCQNCRVSYLFLQNARMHVFLLCIKPRPTIPSCHSSTKKLKGELGITFLARYVLIVSTLYFTFLLRQVEWWYMPDIMAQRTLHIFSLLASRVSSQPHKTGIFSFFLFRREKRSQWNKTYFDNQHSQKRTSGGEHIPYFPLMLTTSTTTTFGLFFACKMHMWGTRVSS